MSSLLLMKQQGKQITVDIRQTDSKSIPLEYSFLGRVSSALDSASLIIKGINSLRKSCIYLFSAPKQLSNALMPVSIS